MNDDSVFLSFNNMLNLFCDYSLCGANFVKRLLNFVSLAVIFNLSVGDAYRRSYVKLYILCQ
jgi:hypothetical protein